MGGPVVVGVVERETVGPHARHVGRHSRPHPLQHGGLLLLLLLLRFAEGLPEAGWPVAAHSGGCRKFLAAPTLGEIVGMAVQQRRGQASQTAAKLAAGPQADVVGREGETRMERPVGEAVQAAGGRGRLGAVTKQIQTLLRAAAALVVEPLSCNTENRQNIKIYHPKSLERSFKYKCCSALRTVQYLLYNQRIYTEETAKVVAAVWG